MNGQIPPSTDSVYSTLSSATWVPKLWGGRGERERTLARVGEEAVVVEVTLRWLDVATEVETGRREIIARMDAASSGER